MKKVSRKRDIREDDATDKVPKNQIRVFMIEIIRLPRYFSKPTQSYGNARIIIATVQ